MQSDGLIDLTELAAHARSTNVRMAVGDFKKIWQLLDGGRNKRDLALKVSTPPSSNTPIDPPFCPLFLREVC